MSLGAKIIGVVFLSLSIVGLAVVMIATTNNIIL